MIWRRRVTCKRFSMSKKERGLAFRPPRRNNNRNLCNRLWRSRERRTPMLSCLTTLIFTGAKMASMLLKFLLRSEKVDQRVNSRIFC